MPSGKHTTSGPIEGALELEAMVVRVEQSRNQQTDDLTLMLLETIRVDGERSGRKEGDKVLLSLNFAKTSFIKVK
jgi:hypothetical protein